MRDVRSVGICPADGITTNAKIAVLQMACELREGTEE